MNIPTSTTRNAISVSSLAERDSLLNDPRYRVSGISVSVGDVVYWLNSDLATWSPQESPAIGSVIGTYNGEMTSGGSEQTLLTIAIQESSTCEYRIDWNLYNDTESSSGPQEVVVRRIGDASPTILSEPFGAAFHGDVSAWSPGVEISGNSLLVKATPDAYSDYRAQVAITLINQTDTSDAPIAITASRAKARTLEFPPIFEFWADTGTTPATPDVEADVTAWSDQMAAHNGTGTAGHYATYGEDSGGEPYLKFAGGTSDQYFAIANAVGSQTSHTFRWTAEHDDNAVSSSDVLFTAVTAGSDPQMWIAGHMGATVGSSGTNIGLYTTADGYHVLGASPSGKHDFELRCNGAATTVNGVAAGKAVLYIDGVAGTPVDYTAMAMPATKQLCALNGDYGFHGKVYAFDYQSGVGTDTQMAQWIEMRELVEASHA